MSGAKARPAGQSASVKLKLVEARARNQAAPSEAITAAPTIDVEAMDKALNNQCCALYQAMAIVRLASQRAEKYCHTEGPSELSLGEQTDVWTALNGAHTLLGLIADRLESSETMLAKEVDNV